VFAHPAAAHLESAGLRGRGKKKFGFAKGCGFASQFASELLNTEADSTAGIICAANKRVAVIAANAMSAFGTKRHASRGNASPLL
jgi:hypothetical protein